MGREPPPPTAARRGEAAVSTAPAVRRPSSTRRWLRRVLILTAIGVAVVGAFVGKQLYRQYADQRLLRETIAHLDSRHPRWRLEDIDADRVAIPDPENSASIIRTAHTHVKPLAVQPTDDSVDLQHLDPAAALTDGQLRAVIDLFESVESAVAPALRLEHFPRGRHPIAHSADGIGTRLPHIGDIDDLHKRVLYPLLLMHLHEDDAAAAVRDWVCIAHLGRSIGDEPYGATQAIRSSWAGQGARDLERLLGQVTITDDDLARIQSKFAEEAAYDAWPMFLRDERAMWHRLMTAIQSGMFPSSVVRQFLSDDYGRGPRSRIGEVIDWVNDRVPPDVAGGHARVLVRTTRLLEETAKRPWNERTASVTAANEEGVLSNVRADYRPALQKFQRNNALVGCALVAVAAERHRLRHGTWPALLAEIVPEFLPALPADPFDGQPLRYKRLPEGIVIYSVGPDGVDDGGQVTAIPGQHPMNDVGVRMWDVKRRRQAPVRVADAPND